MKPVNFIINLPYMLYGMISIFAVIGVIIVITVLLNKFSGSDDSSNNK